MLCVCRMKKLLYWFGLQWEPVWVVFYRAAFMFTFAIGAVQGRSLGRILRPYYLYPTFDTAACGKLNFGEPLQCLLSRGTH